MLPAALRNVAHDAHTPVISGRGRRDEVEMDITPMIDMTFLLLIFFLVCSTPDQSTAIEMAKARYGRGVGERDSVIITVSAKGVDSAPVYLADGMIGEPLPTDVEEQSDLIAVAVEKGRRDEGKENVIIKADRNVAHRDVSRVIKAVSRVEGAKIYLGVLEAD
jgi:biopolymer transport protein ExbD